MYSPASWVVVEDRSTSSSVLDPSQKCYGISGIEFTTIVELNIAVKTTKESVGTTTCSIWTTGRSDAAKYSSRISTSTDVTSTVIGVQWIYCQCLKNKNRKMMCIKLINVQQVLSTDFKCVC